MSDAGMTGSDGDPDTAGTGQWLVPAVLATLAALYLLDAVRASTDVRNLILVLPLSVVLFVLCVALIVTSLRKSRTGAESSSRAAHSRKTDDSRAPETASDSAESSFAATSSATDVLRVMGLFAAYVLTLPWLGFDAGSCLFLAAFLWLNGERNRVRLVAYSLGFGLLIAFFFSAMLPYPMPLLLFGSI